MGKHTLKCLACGRAERQNFGLKYFSLPKNSERRARWLNSINKSHLNQSSFSRDIRVCEQHFTADMYSKSKFRLKWSATPSIHILQNVLNTNQGQIHAMIEENPRVMPMDMESLIPVNEVSKGVEVFDKLVNESNEPTIKTEIDDHLNQDIKTEIFENPAEESNITISERELMQTSFKETAEKIQMPSETANDLNLEIKQSPQSSPESTYPNDIDDDCQNSSVTTHSNKMDEFDIFGAFVASELREFRNNTSLIRSVKRKIQVALLELNATEAANTSNRHSSSETVIPQPIQPIIPGMIRVIFPK